MSETPPTLEQWCTLYALADQLKKLAPWEFMVETDIFGMQHPKTQEMGYLSVMGQLGEHLAVAVYCGLEGINGFFKMQDVADAGEEPTPEMILETPQLQISFEDRAELEKQDRDIIKQLGLKFRGGQSWPCFRTYRPGMAPWFLTTEEADLLIVAIQQLLDVAPRYRDDEDLLYPEDEDLYLIRKASDEDGALTWKDCFETIPLPPPVELRYNMGQQLMQALDQAQPVTNVIEVDFFIMASQIREKGQRPYFPYMLMIVDADSTMILATDVLSPVPTLQDMWVDASLHVLGFLAEQGVRPKIIRVQSDLVFNLLSPLCDHWQIKLKKVKNLKAMSQVRQELERMLFQ